MNVELANNQSMARVKTTLKMISGNLPLQANLFKWKLVGAPTCLLCNAESEGFSHVQCWCPKLKESRIKGHHIIWEKIVDFLKRWAKPTFTFSTEEELTNLKLIKASNCSETTQAEWNQVCQDLDTALQEGAYSTIGGAVGDLIEQLKTHLPTLDDEASQDQSFDESLANWDFNLADQIPVIQNCRMSSSALKKEAIQVLRTACSEILTCKTAGFMDNHSILTICTR